MHNPRLIHAGFDGLDLAIEARTPLELQSCLEAAQERAADRRGDVPVSYRGCEFLVGQGGKSGGYRFAVDTGALGSLFFFKVNNPRDPWGVFVSARALPLATKGPEVVKAEMDAFLQALGIEYDPDQARVSRADFAVDQVVDEFILDTDLVVSHSRMKHSGSRYVEDHGISQKRTGVRIGKMPGRQVAIYDKRADVLDKNKDEWWSIWNANARAWHGSTVDQSSAICRCEIRLGSRHLSKVLKLRTWPRFLAEASELFLDVAKRVRYAEKRDSVKRTYWPNSALWEGVVGAIARMERSDALAEILPDVLRRMQAQHVAQLEAQLSGVFRALAAANRVSWADIQEYLKYVFSQNYYELEPGNSELAAAYGEKCREWRLRYGAV